MELGEASRDSTGFGAMAGQVLCAQAWKPSSQHAGETVFPSGEPGVSGDFWGSQEGCQGPVRSGPSQLHSIPDFSEAP